MSAILFGDCGCCGSQFIGRSSKKLFWATNSGTLTFNDCSNLEEINAALFEIFNCPVIQDAPWPDPGQIANEQTWSLRLSFPIVWTCSSPVVSSLVPQGNDYVALTRSLHSVFDRGGDGFFAMFRYGFSAPTVYAVRTTTTVGAVPNPIVETSWKLGFGSEVILTPSLQAIGKGAIACYGDVEKSVFLPGDPEFPTNLAP